MRVVAAMSGGVDSSVTAALLKEQGHEVIGIHMKLHDAPAPTPTGQPAKRCCGLDDAWDARRVAHQLEIPFYVMDLRTAFRKAVMDYFTQSYLKGLTPNPCIQCNGVLKFQILLQRAQALGASHLATGHYARTDPSGSLFCALDPAKDQSYFLFPVTRAALRQTLFPLGGLSKPEVRSHAERLGLMTAQKPESQEICFIPDDNHARFIREQHPTAEGAGEIVDEAGKVLGQHDGYWRFTIGQRRGLGVAVGKPVYVLSIDPQSGRVVVGPSERLSHRRIHAAGMNWLRRPAADTEVLARIRHRGALHRCTVTPVSGHEDDASEVEISFGSPARAGTPGQAVVLYDGAEVLGGGWIRKASA